MYGDARDDDRTLETASAARLRAQTAIARRAYRFDVPGDEGFDPYIVLGLRRNATKTDIRAAYLVFAKELHPDRRAGDPEAERRFKAINYAYHALLLAKKQERLAKWRLSSYPMLVAMGAFLAPCVCFAVYVLLYLPEIQMISKPRTIMISASQRIETTGSLPRPHQTTGFQTVSIEEITDPAPFQSGADDAAPFIDREMFLTQPPEETDSLFLSALHNQQDMLVVHNYLKLDPAGREAAKVREHLRNLILNSRDRKQLAALVDLVTQDDHIEAALALGRLKKLAEEEINASETMRWVAAIRTKTKAAYETYLGGYPKGRFSASARKLLAAFSAPKPVHYPAVLKIAKDNEAWKSACAQNTKAAYDAYISAYPNGRFANQANRKLASIDPAARTLAPKVTPASVSPQPRRETSNAPLWPSADEPLIDQRMR